MTAIHLVEAGDAMADSKPGPRRKRWRGRNLGGGQWGRRHQRRRAARLDGWGWRRTVEVVIWAGWGGEALWQRAGHAGGGGWLFGR